MISKTVSAELAIKIHFSTLPCRPSIIENKDHTSPLVLHRAFMGGEPTDTVARSVTRGITSTVPFIIALGRLENLYIC